MCRLMAAAYERPHQHEIYLLLHLKWFFLCKTPFKNIPKTFKKYSNTVVFVKVTVAISFKHITIIQS